MSFESMLHALHGIKVIFIVIAIVIVIVKGAVSVPLSGTAHECVFCHISDLVKFKINSSEIVVQFLNDLIKGIGDGGGRGKILLHKIQTFGMNLACNWAVPYCSVKLVNRPLGCTT